MFCCKQKTAYEMRISDWSSDLCSSDLDEELPALRLRVSPTSAAWSVLKRIPGGPMSRVLIGKADDVAAGEARKLARIRIGEMQQGVDPNVAKRQRKADAERSGMTLAQGRSEEHTSELQSLMRSSY